MIQKTGQILPKKQGNKFPIRFHFPKLLLSKTEELRDIKKKVKRGSKTYPVLRTRRIGNKERSRSMAIVSDFEAIEEAAHCS